MSSAIHLDQFEHHVEFLDNNFSNDCNSSNWIPSAYPGVVMNIVLTRNIGYHLLQTYLPSTFFVILGKLCFSKWHSVDAILQAISPSTYLLTQSLAEWQWQWRPSWPWQQCSVESGSQCPRWATSPSWTSGWSCASSSPTSTCLSSSLWCTLMQARDKISVDLLRKFVELYSLLHSLSLFFYTGHFHTLKYKDENITIGCSQKHEGSISPPTSRREAK